MDVHLRSVYGELKDREAREQYAEDFLAAHLALQIKALRAQRGWTQSELAERAGKKQSQISAMEQIDFSSWKVSTLQQLAKAFDLALMVRFESFGKFFEEALRLDSRSLEEVSFSDDVELAKRVDECNLRGTVIDLAAERTLRAVQLHALRFEARATEAATPYALGTAAEA
jgi:transcriptional regulator with XRE-family HTH domain